MKLLHEYVNGNYFVKIYEDGTKVRETQENSFIPEFSENIDIKVTDYCQANCAFCHEKSTIFGQHANLDVKYIETLHKGTELAVGGGNPLDHPHIFDFLLKLKDLGIIANITVNQYHFQQTNYRRFLDDLIESNLVYGVGLSMKTPTKEFIDAAKKYDNMVIHTINGINPLSHFEELSGNGLKVLILGYKIFGRGEKYYNEMVETNKSELYKNLCSVLNGFKIVSFDNLAIEQLNPKRFMSNRQWEEFYMGDDGSHTFYIDMVKNQFAKNSTSPERYNIEDGMSIKDMFSFVRQLK